MPGVYGLDKCSALCLQVEQLRSIKDTAHQNGVTDVDWISVAEVGALEPAVQCVAALISPSTGVVDGRACAPSFDPTLRKLALEPPGSLFAGCKAVLQHFSGCSSCHHQQNADEEVGASAAI